MQKKMHQRNVDNYTTASNMKILSCQIRKSIL